MLTFATALLYLSRVLAAAPAQTPQAPEGPPVLTAVRVPQAPTVDGDVLSDAVWQLPKPVTTFWQEQPDEGQPASEANAVRIVYTADTVYIGVVCYDRSPGTIIVSDSRRDAPLDNTDSFRIIFDTYRDRLNGFVFGTNPAGIEYDGQVTNEGQGGGGLGASQRTQAGSGGGFNVNWDGAWQVRARITDIVTHLARARLSYSFTTRAFVQGLLQYNNRADLWSANVHFGWLQAANTGLFIVYTDTRGLYDLLPRPERTDRSFVVKFSRMFDVLR